LAPESSKTNITTGDLARVLNWGEEKNREIRKNRSEGKRLEPSLVVWIGTTQEP